MDREFLGIRCRLIELAAALDRIDRASDASAADPRLVQIRRSLEVLLAAAPHRAERVQAEFSLPYDEHWREHKEG
jgi:hypothetical protein